MSRSGGAQGIGFASACAGDDALDKLSQQTGMAGPKLLEALSQQLPEVVNQLTPEGRLPPSEEEAAHGLMHRHRIASALEARAPPMRYPQIG